ncbi:MAG: hypothetical protein M1812_007464 [Candelaria pacifica]|nr:MAG: hypothetical protein M1812_007464 [Candelaria pacifica]
MTETTPLEIKKLQDAYGNDLDLAYTVCDVFRDRDRGDQMSSVVRVVQQPFDRESSILPQSTLRPQTDLTASVKRGRPSDWSNGFQGAPNGVRPLASTAIGLQDDTEKSNKRPRFLESVVHGGAHRMDPEVPVLSRETSSRGPRDFHPTSSPLVPSTSMQVVEGSQRSPVDMANGPSDHFDGDIKSENSNLDEDLYIVPNPNMGSPLLGGTPSRMHGTDGSVARLRQERAKRMKRRGSKRINKTEVKPLPVGTTKQSTRNPPPATNGLAQLPLHPQLTSRLLPKPLPEEKTSLEDGVSSMTKVTEAKRINKDMELTESERKGRREVVKEQAAMAERDRKKAVQETKDQAAAVERDRKAAEATRKRTELIERKQKKEADKREKALMSAERKRQQEAQETERRMAMTKGEKQKKIQRMEGRMTLTEDEQQQEADEAVSKALEALRRNNAQGDRQRVPSTTPPLRKVTQSMAKTPSPLIATGSPPLSTKRRRSVSFADRPLLSTGTGQTSSPTKSVSIIKNSPPKKTKEVAIGHSWSKILPPGVDQAMLTSPPPSSQHPVSPITAQRNTPVGLPKKIAPETLPPKQAKQLVPKNVAPKTAPPKKNKQTVIGHSWSKILPPGVDQEMPTSPQPNSRHPSSQLATQPVTTNGLPKNLASKPTSQPASSSPSKILHDVDTGEVTTFSPTIPRLKMPSGLPKRKAQKPSVVPAAQQPVLGMLSPIPDPDKIKSLPPSSQASSPHPPSSLPQNPQPTNNALPQRRQPSRRIQTNLNLIRDVKGKGRVHDPPSPARTPPKEEIVISSGDEGPIVISPEPEQEPARPYIAKAGPSDPAAIRAFRKATRRKMREKQLKEKEKKSRAPSPSVVIFKQGTPKAVNGVDDDLDMPSSPPLSSTSPGKPAIGDPIQSPVLPSPSQPPRTPSPGSESEVEADDTPSPTKRAVHIQLDRHGSGVPIDGFSETPEVTTFPLRSGRIRSNSIPSPPKFRNTPLISADAKDRADKVSQLFSTQDTESKTLEEQLQQDARRSMDTISESGKKKSKSRYATMPFGPTLAEFAEFLPKLDPRTNGELAFGKDRSHVAKSYAAMRRYQASQAPKLPEGAGGTTTSSESSDESEEEDTGVARLNPDMPKKYRGLFKSTWLFRSGA